MQTLSLSDVGKLIQDPDQQTKSQMVEKLTKDLNRDLFSSRERTIVFDIVRLLIRDTAVLVRRTIAENLKHNQLIPHDIVLTLANDDDIDVSRHILKCSQVLTEDDLLQIIGSTSSVAKLLVISKRQHLPATLATALIKREIKEVSEAVIANKTAHITEEAYDCLINRYEHHPDLLSKMVERNDLPISIIEKLIHLVEEDVAKTMAEKYQLDLETINNHQQNLVETITQTSKKSLKDEIEKYNLMIQIASTKTTLEEMNTYVSLIKKQRQLSHSLAIHALCTGNLLLFTVTLAHLADISAEHANTIIKTKIQDPTFEALYRRATMPSPLLLPIKEVITYLQELIANHIPTISLKDELYQHFKEFSSETGFEQLLPLMNPKL
ncbi:MAG: DUF2336 domain-containing protein [Alphaproteobacteria bacterium]|nr:DUF2336 domain-containing protein [Alphaproteobacteria bacterium]